MISDVLKENRLTQLKALLEILADEIDQRPGARDLAQLSRQYRETLKEIEEIEGSEVGDDKIGELLASRESSGKPGAVRQNRSAV